DAGVIDVRADDDVGVTELRIAAADHADDVRRAVLGLRDAAAQTGGDAGERNGRLRAAHERVEIEARCIEHGACGVTTDGEHRNGRNAATAALGCRGGLGYCVGGGVVQDD